MGRIVHSTVLGSVSVFATAGLWLVSSVFAEIPADGTSPLDVMSFNIRFDNQADGVDRWDARRERVVATIRGHEADLIGTQEVLVQQARYLRESLPEYAFHGVGRDDGQQQGEFTAIFFRRERLDRIDGGHFWLSESPDQPGSVSWDSSMTRMASWVRLRDRMNGRTLLLVNTHFDHRGPQAREESAKVIAAFLREHRRDSAVVVTGDFNCNPRSVAYERLTGQGGNALGLIDSFREVHSEQSADEGTFNGFVGRTGGPRIDWILHSDDFMAVAAAIVRDHEQDRYPSDHFPVTARLKWHD